MATPALVPAPALPPDLSFSFPNPAKFSASPKQELRQYVAWLLREAEVPAFLWGPEITRIYGSKTHFEYSIWAVKDELMKKAVQVLNEAGLRPCKKGRRCAKHRDLPFPDQHYHKVLKHFNTHVSHGVYLYRKSRFFPHFPDPPLVNPKPDDRYYMLSSNKRLPDWSYSCEQVKRMSKDGYPVIIPTPARYLEAVCLQSVRHYEVQDGSYFWNGERRAMIHILEDRFTDILKLDDLDEPWHEYGKLNIDRGYGDRAGDYGGQKYRLFLYLDMKKKGQLPPPETKARIRWLRPIPDLVREWGLPLDLLD